MVTAGPGWGSVGEQLGCAGGLEEGLGCRKPQGIPWSSTEEHSPPVCQTQTVSGRGPHRCAHLRLSGRGSHSLSGVWGHGALFGHLLGARSCVREDTKMKEVLAGAGVGPGGHPAEDIVRFRTKSPPQRVVLPRCLLRSFHLLSRALHMPTPSPAPRPPASATVFPVSPGGMRGWTRKQTQMSLLMDGGGLRPGAAGQHKTPSWAPPPRSVVSGHCGVTACLSGSTGALGLQLSALDSGGQSLTGQGQGAFTACYDIM